MANARKFLTNLTMLSAGALAAKLITLLAAARMARALGTDLFGDVAFAMAFTLYFDLIVSQGLDVYAIQEVARDRGALGRRAATILGLRLVSSLLAFGALVAAVSVVAKPAHTKSLLLVYGLTFLPSALSLKWVFQAVEEMKFVALANVVGQLVFAGFVLAFVWGPRRLLWIPAFQFLGDLTAALFLIRNYRRRFGRIRFAFHLRSWGSMLKESIPMGLSSALSLVMFNFDVLLLGFLKPASDVGQYGAAYKIIGFLSSLIVLYGRNLFPSVSRCRDRPEALRRASEVAQKYSLAFAIPAAAGGMILAGPLMRAIFGPEFAGGAWALAVLLWIIPAASCRAFYRATLLSHGMQNANLGITVAAVAVNLGLNLVLIPRYSFRGSAVASLVAEMLLLGLMIAVVSRRLTPLPLWRFVWRPLLASAPMAAFLILFPSWFILIRIGGGLILYLGAAFALRIYKAEELREIFGLSIISATPP
jgi:O-antigen/teichoic acid export membrane protein